MQISKFNRTKLTHTEIDFPLLVYQLAGQKINLSINAVKRDRVGNQQSGNKSRLLVK